METYEHLWEDWEPFNPSKIKNPYHASIKIINEAKAIVNDIMGKATIAHTTIIKTKHDDPFLNIVFEKWKGCLGEDGKIKGYIVVDLNKE